jgi:photosystem II stability/assembly factor-like uncharacterized protein
MVYENHNAAIEISAAPDGTLWIVGEGNLLKSDDQGYTWVRPVSLDPWFNEQNWKAITFAPDGTGVIAGDASCVGVTRDGGANWSAYCSDKVKFGLMFDIAIKGESIVIASSSDTAHDSISRLTIPR